MRHAHARARTGTRLRVHNNAGWVVVRWRAPTRCVVGLPPVGQELTDDELI
eukprot:COSAG01_NODE_16889_length_1196_cov_1.120328_3_plen_50_part_01